MTKLELERVFNEIMLSDMFRVDGDKIDLPEKVIELCKAVHDHGDDEFKWSIGEHLDCCLGDFIVGAYWSFTEWHGGQFSIEYQALCSLGWIFRPNMSSGPEEGTSEAYAYKQCNEWFQNKYPNKSKQ